MLGDEEDVISVRKLSTLLGVAPVSKPLRPKVLSGPRPSEALGGAEDALSVMKMLGGNRAMGPRVSALFGASPVGTSTSAAADSACEFNSWFAVRACLYLLFGFLPA